LRCLEGRVRSWPFFRLAPDRTDEDHGQGRLRAYMSLVP
jgi:hypothetical protein